MLVVRLAHVALRCGTNRVLPCRKPFEGKPPLIACSDASFFIIQKNRNLRLRNGSAGHSIHHNACDAISAPRVSLWIYLAKRGHQRQKEENCRHGASSPCSGACTSTSTVTSPRGPRFTSRACAKYRSMAPGLRNSKLSAPLIAIT